MACGCFSNIRFGKVRMRSIQMLTAHIMNQASRIVSTYICLPRKVYWSVVLVIVSISFMNNFGLSKEVMKVLATVQAGVALIAFHYIITMLMFRKYESRNVQKLMDNPVVLIVRWIILCAITASLMYGLYFFAQRVPYTGS